MRANLSEPTPDRKTDRNPAVATWFATPERVSPAELRPLATSTADDPLVRIILKSLGGYVLILEPHRQILSASRELVDALGAGGAERLVGLRAGEALGCPHAEEGPGGCGTSRNCRWCGAVLATLAALSTDEPSVGECCLRMRTARGEETKEFGVRATPFVAAGCKLVALVLRDVSSEKRRQVLERVFLHDLSNATQALLGWGTLFDESPEEAAARIVRISEYLTREIEGQRLLRSAEAGELKIRIEELSVAELFATLGSLAATASSTKGPAVGFKPPEPGAVVRTDMALLLRVLLNMVKNAVEASAPGEAVEVSFVVEGGRPTFLVRNPGVMPPDVALRVFERSFSTKRGHGRGIGTYSMRLFGESYLGGKVWFTSRNPEGTIFRLSLPAEGAGARRRPSGRAHAPGVPNHVPPA